jgi:hypothetical protein
MRGWSCARKVITRLMRLADGALRRVVGWLRSSCYEVLKAHGSVLWMRPGAHWGEGSAYKEARYSPHIRYIAIAESTSVERQILFLFLAKVL